MDNQIWHLIEGDSPLVATAVHDGHRVRAELEPLLRISPSDRLREEDPFTAEWTRVAPTRIVGLNSRFEVDLNRPREKAVYISPQDAWGLDVWKEPLPVEHVERSLARYDAFYTEVHRVLSGLAARHGRFVVFDLHSYNHRRGGPDAPIDDPEANPQVNIGTGTMDRDRWAPVVDRLITDLRAVDFPGGPLDVRENVKFRGGNFPRWINETFSDTGCAIAIEFKKFFMDEWTGEPDRVMIDQITRALGQTARGVLEALNGD